MNNIKIMQTFHYGIVVTVWQNNWIGSFEFPVTEDFLTTDNIQKLLHSTPKELKEINNRQYHDFENGLGAWK